VHPQCVLDVQPVLGEGFGGGADHRGDALRWAVADEEDSGGMYPHGPGDDLAHGTAPAGGGGGGRGQDGVGDEGNPPAGGDDGDQAVAGVETDQVWDDREQVSGGLGGEGLMRRRDCVIHRCAPLQVAGMRARRPRGVRAEAVQSRGSWRVVWCCGALAAGLGERGQPHRRRDG
jgi:hypothetical protein